MATVYRIHGTAALAPETGAKHLTAVTNKTRTFQNTDLIDILDDSKGVRFAKSKLDVVVATVMTCSAFSLFCGLIFLLA